MDLQEIVHNFATESRDFGPGCFSISSFSTFLMTILVTIVNVNNNMNAVKVQDFRDF